MQRTNDMQPIRADGLSQRAGLNWRRPQPGHGPTPKADAGSRGKNPDNPRQRRRKRRTRPSNSGRGGHNGVSPTAAKHERRTSTPGQRQPQTRSQITLHGEVNKIENAGVNMTSKKGTTDYIIQTTFGSSQAQSWPRPGSPAERTAERDECE